VADDSERETERTTIVRSDGDGRGSAWIILVVALIVIILALLFFGGVFDRDESELNVQINTPDVNVIVPETQVPVVTVPEVQVPPDVNVNVITPPAEPPEQNLSNTETPVTNRG
jgi:hypothetical protein